MSDDPSSEGGTAFPDNIAADPALYDRLLTEKVNPTTSLLLPLLLIMIIIIIIIIIIIFINSYITIASLFCKLLTGAEFPCFVIRDRIEKERDRKGEATR
jgi:hypothetical protein